MLRLKTAGKVRHFQHAHGLKATGHLDRATTRKLRVHNQNARASKGSSSAAPRKAPVDPLTRAANQQANVEYAPQINQARGQIASSGQALLNTGAWYQDYVNKVEQAKQQAADAYSNAENMLIRQASASDTADRQGNQQLADQMAAQAKISGTTVDPSIQATGNQAAASRQAAISTMLANLGTQGANASTALAERGAVASGAKANALTAETNRGRNLKVQLSQLQSQRGQKAAAYRSQLAKDQLNAQIAEQGLGIKIGQLGVNKQNAATSRLAARSLSKNRKVSAKETHRSHVAQENLGRERNSISAAKGKGKGSKKTPKAESQSSKNFKLKVDDARSEIRRLKGQGKTGPQITKDARKHGVEPVVLNIARDLEYLGYVSGPNVAAARRAGIRIPKQWKTKKVGLPKAVSALGGVLQGFNG